MEKLRSRLEMLSPWFLSLLRIVIAVLILQHGGQKVLGYPASKLPTPPMASLGGIAGLIELTGGIFLLAGFLTRLAAFILSGEMAAAYFLVHFREGWWPIHNGGELAVIYCFVFLYLSIAGGGPVSIDGFISKRRSAEPSEI